MSNRLPEEGFKCDSTLEVSDYVGHGHAQGRQGPKGHTMPKSEHASQSGAYLRQDVYGKDGGPSFDDNRRAASDYGVADEKTD